MGTDSNNFWSNPGIFRTLFVITVVIIYLVIRKVKSKK